MAGQLPSFLSGSTLEIRIGSATFAYAQALSFSDDMTITPVGGIGSYNYHALEPTDYAARGSIVITAYSDKVLSALKTVSSNLVPANVRDAKAQGNNGGDGNSLLKADYFSPVMLLTSLSFDIHVYGRKPVVAGTSVTNQTGNIIYSMQNARFGSYGFGFTPGSLLSESLSFVCTAIVDYRSEFDTKAGA